MGRECIGGGEFKLAAVVGNKRPERFKRLALLRYRATRAESMISIKSATTDVRVETRTMAIGPQSATLSSIAWSGKSETCSPASDRVPVARDTSVPDRGPTGGSSRNRASRESCPDFRSL